MPPFFVSCWELQKNEIDKLCEKVGTVRVHLWKKFEEIIVLSLRTNMSYHCNQTL